MNKKELNSILLEPKLSESGDLNVNNKRCDFYINDGKTNGIFKTNSKLIF